MRKAIIWLCQKLRLSFFGDLVIEKRCADLIQESILDGIFILRGDELVFSNPVGRKILGLAPDSSPQGFRLSQLMMQSALSVIPRELTLEFKRRKNYYLIRSFPLSEAWADRLVIAQDVTLIKESREVKNCFLDTLSHEMKTPMTSLMMATRLLKQGINQVSHPTLQNLVLTSVGDVDRLKGLMDDLSSAFMLNPFTPGLKVQRLDFRKFFSHLLQFLQSEAHEKEINLVHCLRGDEKPIFVAIDPIKMTWALYYLTSYAFMRTPQGGEVVVSVEVQGSVVQVKVQDQGPGIELNRQNQIWTAASPSDGMGLAIAKDVIVAHGGRIWLTSEPGQSVEFYFNLPLKYLKTQAASKETVHNPLFPLKGVSSGTRSRC